MISLYLLLTTNSCWINPPLQQPMPAYNSMHSS